VGERIVVHGIQHEAVVESVEWDKEAYSWKIFLNWSLLGRSRVWAHDENKVWYRWKDNN